MKARDEEDDEEEDEEEEEVKEEEEDGEEMVSAVRTFLPAVSNLSMSAAVLASCASFRKEAFH